MPPTNKTSTDHFRVRWMKHWSSFHCNCRVPLVIKSIVSKISSSKNFLNVFSTTGITHTQKKKIAIASFCTFLLFSSSTLMPEQWGRGAAKWNVAFMVIRHLAALHFLFSFFREPLAALYFREQLHCRAFVLRGGLVAVSLSAICVVLVLENECGTVCTLFTWQMGFHPRVDLPRR